MTHLSFALLIAVSFLILMMLGAIIGMFGSRSGSYLRWASQSELVFRKPLLLSISMVMFGFGILLFPLWMVAQAMEEKPTISTDELAGYVFIMLLLCIPFGGALIWSCGQDELRLNLDTRTYTWTKNRPFHRRIRSGLWADLRGVYVGWGRSTYIVGIKSGVMDVGSPVGRYDRQSSAEQFANELAVLLDLPRVPPSYPLFDPPPAIAKSLPSLKRLKFRSLIPRRNN